MEVKVIKKFNDKHSKKQHKPGDVLTITKERLKEICKVDASLVQVIEQAAEEETAAETETEEVEQAAEETATATATATKTTRKKKGE